METGLQTCHWHPDQPAGVICQRCDRPICPRCMHQASVGFHCPECARAGGQKVYRGIPVSKPTLTFAIIALNVVAFVIGVIVDGSGSIMGDSGRFAIDFALIAKGAASTSSGGYELIGVGDGEWYRMITSGFLHYGIIHLAMNMYMLYMLGRMAEPGGRLRLGTIYGTALLAGSAGALIVSPGSLTAGASGAIFGLMGAVFMGHRSQGMDWRNSPLLNVIILNLVFTFGLARMISVGGHVGGLIGGAVAGWLLYDFARKPGIPKWLPYALTGGVAAVCAVSGIVFATNWTG